jgi:chromosome segregation ATPase
MRADQNELENIRSLDQEKLAGLQQRTIDAEAARDAAWHQVEALKLTLADASSRIDASETRITEVETARDATCQQLKILENSLTNVSSKLEGAESRISVLDVTLFRAHKEQQADMKEIQTRVRNQSRRLIWSVLLATFAFILAIAASVTSIMDTRNDTEALSEVSRNIKGITQSMEQYYLGLDESLREALGKLIGEVAKVNTLEAETTTARKNARDTVTRESSVHDRRPSCS